jgi:cytochrome c5
VRRLVGSEMCIRDRRIAAGMDALYASALNGKNTMPAKGGNPALSDAEVKAAVDYMVEKAK